MSTDSSSYYSALDSDSSFDFISADVTLGTKLAQRLSQFNNHFNVFHINAQRISQYFNELYNTFDSLCINTILVSESRFEPSYNSIPLNKGVTSSFIMVGSCRLYTFLNIGDFVVTLLRIY